MTTRRQEERARRDKAILEDYRRLVETHGGRFSRWRIVGAVAWQYGLNPETVSNIVKRMEGKGK